MDSQIADNESKNEAGFFVSMIMTLILSGLLGTLSSGIEAILVFSLVLILKIGICAIDMKYKRSFSIFYCYFILDGLLLFFVSYYLGILNSGFIIAVLGFFALCGILIHYND